MSDPAIALQAALFRRLTSELSVPVYDAVPQGTPYPYVTIDSEMTANVTPLSGRKRASRLIYLSVWSNYQGQAEVKRINAEIEAALDRRPLDIAPLDVMVMDGELFVLRDQALLAPKNKEPPASTGRAFGVTVERMSTNREPDGITYQGSVTVRIFTQQ